MKTFKIGYIFKKLNINETPAVSKTMKTLDLQSGHNITFPIS